MAMLHAQQLCSMYVFKIQKGFLLQQFWCLYFCAEQVVDTVLVQIIPAQ